MTVHRMAPQRVLWILCDELRADALSCYGNTRPEVSTPNIDRLAGEGVLFESSFTTSPVCVPARTSLFTGRLPQETGVYGNEAHAADYPLERMLTFPEVLADQGWSTSDFGKEHVPESLQPWQSQDPAGSSMMDLMHDARRAGSEPLRTPGIGHVIGGSVPVNGDYSARAVTTNAIQAIEASSVQSLIRASFLQPHTPVIAPEPWISRYADVDFPTDHSTAEAPNEFERRFGQVNAGASMSADDIHQAQAYYHGTVAWIDDQVGALLNRLDELGIADETAVILTSDHGAYLGEDGGFGKHTFAPQSHRVPLIVRWPGGLAAGQRRSDLAHGNDLARTVLGLCGVAAPDEIGGRDLFTDPAPDHIISSIGYGSKASRAFPNLDAGVWSDTQGWPQRFCVRTRRYRLDLNVRINGEWASEDEADVFLADTLVDRGERVNVFGRPEYAAVQAHLMAAARAAVAAAVQPAEALVYGAFTPPAVSAEFRRPTT